MSGHMSQHSCLSKHTVRRHNTSLQESQAEASHVGSCPAMFAHHHRFLRGIATMKIHRPNRNITVNKVHRKAGKAESQRPQPCTFLPAGKSLHITIYRFLQEHQELPCLFNAPLVSRLSPFKNAEKGKHLQDREQTQHVRLQADLRESFKNCRRCREGTKNTCEQMVQHLQLFMTTTPSMPLGLVLDQSHRSHGQDSNETRLYYAGVKPASLQHIKERRVLVGRKPPSTRLTD
ncbi:uncharacterized protein [Dendropsophus ebraccatus]|uniref:uncharacterized protein n=1 Tax=Dendropsophus ebraccatus TaxID=150705 RepID=UPI003831EB03